MSEVSDVGLSTVMPRICVELNDYSITGDDPVSLTLHLHGKTERPINGNDPMSLTYLSHA